MLEDYPGIGAKDEYFRLALSMRDDAAVHPALNRLLPQIRRGLSKIQSWRFAAEIRRRTIHSTVLTPSGLQVAANIHGVDQLRIGPRNRSHYNGAVLPPLRPPPADTHQVVPVMEHQMGIPLAKDLAEKVDLQPLHRIGAGVFQYRFLRPTGQSNPGFSAWRLWFYEAVAS